MYSSSPWNHMRRPAWSNKKVRGIPRRLRALAQWAADFDVFPIDITDEELYYSFKIPVSENMVSGKNSKLAIRQECAQRLIDTCVNLINTKPESSENYRVVAIICLPNMFMSEVCIYIDEMQYHNDTQPRLDHFPFAYPSCVITERSFAKERGLILPLLSSSMASRSNTKMKITTSGFIRERWYFGEVQS